MIIANDKQAFTYILNRLEGEVGGIVDLVKQSNSKGHPLTPHWALLRCLFPIAESVADLIYHDKSKGTALRLVRVLQNEFQAERTGYQPVASIITHLYRHCLTHQDEMRVLESKGRTAEWCIHLFGGGHLEVIERAQRGSR